MSHADRLEDLAKSTLGIEDGFPGVGADQKTCPERHDNEREQERFVPAGPRGQEVGQRIAYDQAGNGSDKGHAQCHQEDIDVQLVGKLLVAIQDEAGLDPAIWPGYGEADADHLRQRRQAEHTVPENSGQQEDEAAYTYWRTALQHENSLSEWQRTYP